MNPQTLPREIPPSEPPEDETPQGLKLALILLVFPLVTLLLPPLLTGRIFFHEDLEFYFYPLRGWLRHVAAEKALIGWNPWVSTGIPLLADIQLAPFYPFNLLFYALPTSLAFQLSFVLHFAIGTYLSFGFFRALGRSPLAAALGTLIYLWGGFFWAHLHHVTFLAAGVWLPGMLWGWERLKRGRGGIALLSASVALSVLAGGSPQIVYYSLVLLALRVLLDLNAVPWRQALRQKALALTVVGLGVLAGAVQLVPFYLATLEKYREPLDKASYAGLFALSPLSLGRLLVPDLFGNDFFGLNGVGFDGPSTYWESWCYLGIVTLPLVGVCLRRGGPERFYRWVLGLSFLASLGKVGGLHYLLVYLVPGYAAFRAPSRLWMLVGLSAGVLASWTLDRLTLASNPADASAAESASGLAERLRRINKIFLVLGMELWGLCGLSIFARSQPLHPVALHGWLAAGGMMLMTWVLFRRWAATLETGTLESSGVAHSAGAAATPGRQRLALFAVLFLSLDLSWTLSTFNQSVDAEVASRVPELVSQVQARVGHERVLTDRSAPHYLLNGGMDYGFRNLRGYNPLNPAALERFLEISDGSGPREGGISMLVNDVNAPNLGALAPRLLISGAPIEQGRFVEVWRDEKKGLYLGEDPAVLPRAYLTGRVQVVPSAEVAMSQARQLWRFVPPEVSVVSEAGELPKLDPGAPLSSKVEWVEDSPDHVRLHIESTGPQLLVLSDQLAPGWTATLNGQPVEMWNVWGLVRGVMLPGDGPFDVRFSYQTPGLEVGTGISLVAVLALLGLLMKRAD